MAIVNVTGISGINSITAQSNTLNFYTAAGNTLSIGASVSGNITGNVTGNVNATGLSTFSGGIQVGDTLLRSNSIGIGTTTTTGRNAGVGTATGTLIYNSSTGSVEGYFGTTIGWVTIKNGFAATGGNVVISPGNGYKYHTFTSPGSFVASNGTTNIEVLLVAGGGAGGYDVGGGGGAGGLVYAPSMSIGPGTYPVTIGAGGAAVSTGSVPATPASGSPSSFNGLTALGGGGGGNWNAQPGVAGGSGGGPTSNVSGGPGPGTQPAQLHTAGTAYLSFGRPGGGGAGNGPGANEYSGAAGGGGAGGDGGGGASSGWSADSTTIGYGGPGLQFPQFTGSLIGVPSLAPLNGYFAGGGGSCSDLGTYYGRGGTGGGGPGCGTPGPLPGAGTANSGGGGGGAGQNSNGIVAGKGGNGGSGILVIRYLE